MKNWSSVQNYTHKEIVQTYGIPPDEAAAFKENIRVYKKGALIIKEGDEDQILFFLRHGEVGVHKKYGQTGSKRIAVIEAVNFFGEMSLVTGEKRAATIDVLSSEALVYAMPSADVYKIMQHKRWGELMFTRLCKNLADSNEKLAAAQEDIIKFDEQTEPLKKKYEAEKYKFENLKKLTIRIFSTLIALQKAVKGEAVVTSRGWKYLMALDSVTLRLLRRYLPEINSELGEADSEMIKTGIGGKEITKENQLLAELFEDYF